MQILILDDQASIRGLLVSLLEDEYEIVTGNSGMEGVQLLKGGLMPDLILLDLLMPELSGLQFLDFLRTSGIFGEVPVIVLSGAEDFHMKNRCQEMGINAFVPKPFNPLELKQKIKQILNIKIETNYR